MSTRNYLVSGLYLLANDASGGVVAGNISGLTSYFDTGSLTAKNFTGFKYGTNGYIQSYSYGGFNSLFCLII